MKQEELRDKLLSGEIEFKEFYDEILALDQSFDNRREAINNSRILYHSQIVAYVNSANTDIQGHYYKILCLTEFHIGQIKAFEERKQDDAIPHFKKALEYMAKSPGRPEFADYIQTTIAYLENDIEKVKEFMDRDKEGNNPIITKHMYEGLKERGRPAYWEDYRV